MKRSAASSCSIEGCTRPAQTRQGICRLHYNRHKVYGRYHSAEAEKPIPDTVICAYPGCGMRITERLPGFWVHIDWPFHVPDHLARQP